MKSLIVNYDEFGNPISLQDVKEFRDNSVVSYQKLCESNLAKKKKRDEARQAMEEEAEAERLKRNRIRSAWIARLYYEHLLDNGAEAMDDEAYAEFVKNFNNGDVLGMEAMPKAFKECYDSMEGGL